MAAETGKDVCHDSKKLIVLRMFFDNLAYISEDAIANLIIPCLLDSWG